MRVAILGDTHGLLDPRIADAVTRCDYALHAGDVGCASVLDQLRPRQGLVLGVRGNNDTVSKWPPGEEHILARLPEEAEIQLPGGTVLVVHGHHAGPVNSRHRRLRQKYSHARAIVYGHSHRRVCDTKTTPWVLNPGAAGRARTFGGPSFLILYATGRSWRVETRCFQPQGTGQISASFSRAPSRG